MVNKIKNRYLQTIGVIAVILSLVRCVFPNVAGNLNGNASADEESMDSVSVFIIDESTAASRIAYVKNNEMFHRIISVSSYAKAFPDSNHVQLVAAQKWGVSPVKNRKDAEQRKDELVYVGSSPYYSVAKLSSSIPYLVPRAALLLDDIGRTFFDSLQVKGIPIHRIVLSSALRTQEDVARLRRTNANATEHSCHLYATTFDISYNKYSIVYDPDGVEKENLEDVRLKQVLSEVLNDMRQQGRCYIKYESREPCFHITVR